MNNKELSDIYKQSLTLRWSPVAVRLMRPGEEIPEGVVEPTNPMRHCQSVIAARRGNCLYMPPRKHACPDGSGILGMTEMSEKLRSGDLYLLFKKLPNIEICQKMIAGRPEYKPGTHTATLLAPLEKATFEPDVVLFTVYPEQAMWMCCASTYADGKRLVFPTCGYNTICADLTVEVMNSGKMNIGFGCYGNRASTEINDFELYVSVPYSQLPVLAEPLEKLAAKSIIEERNKIYIPPVMDNQSKPGQQESGDIEVIVNHDLCQGCGLCEAFCPASVFEMIESAGFKKSHVAAGDKCSACYTCVGQCPQKAIQLKYL